MTDGGFDLAAAGEEEIGFRSRRLEAEAKASSVAEASNGEG